MACPTNLFNDERFHELPDQAQVSMRITHYEQQITFIKRMFDIGKTALERHQVAIKDGRYSDLFAGVDKLTDAALNSTLTDLAEAIRGLKIELTGWQAGDTPPAKRELF